MVLEPVLCPYCGSNNVGKHGKSEEGKKRYICKNDKCPRSTFLRDYTYLGCQTETKSRIIEMALNGSGIRDTARVLQISPSTVIEELKKRTQAPFSQYEDACHH
ncbi:MAG: IS1 family transposase [Chloroflexi bacterium]|nr:IS1 family transposase [Chloroflexota bacterium]